MVMPYAMGEVLNLTTIASITWESFSVTTTAGDLYFVDTANVSHMPAHSLWPRGLDMGVFERKSAVSSVDDKCNAGKE